MKKLKLKLKILKENKVLFRKKINNKGDKFEITIFFILGLK